MKSVKVYLYVSAPPEPTDPQYVCLYFPYKNTVRSAPPKHPSTQ